MKYNFDNPPNRRGSGSIKWDVQENELPMWVADMDFETAPCIKEALQKRVEHGVFGYTDVYEDWYNAYITWWKQRHNFTIQKEWLVYASGVVPILSSAVRKFTTPGENVLIQTPVYNVFFNSIVNNGRNVLQSPLRYDGERYEIDFERLENDLSNPQTTLMILCNPHNPCGNIWSVDELGKIGEICEKYGVIVISDEIHCDITEPDREYVPFAAASEKCRKVGISCIAPTKAFNIAGIQTAAAYSANPILRHKIWRGLNTDEVGEPNVFAAIAPAAAFGGGAEWLDELREYISQNKKAVYKFLAENVPEIHAVPSEATYLMWLDCGKFTKDSIGFAAFIRRETGLYTSAGAVFGGNGNEFLRLNTACSRSTLCDGLSRLKRACEIFRKEDEKK